MACDSALRLFSVKVRGLQSNIVQREKQQHYLFAETYITKDVSEGWKKEWGGKLTYKVEENWAGRVENIKRIIHEKRAGGKKERNKNETKKKEKKKRKRDSIAGKVCIYKNIFNFSLYISCKHW